MLRYGNSDPHNLKRSDFTRYANLMRFELKLRSAYISYFLQILLQLSLSLSFHLCLIYYFNFKQRIKCEKERIDFLFPHGSLVQFIFRLQYANSMHCEPTLIPVKKRLFYSNSLPNSITVDY